MRKEMTNPTIFGRVKNRIDLIGKVTKIEKNFVCLKIPDFRGFLEYPSTLVEIVNETTLSGDNLKNSK